MIGPILAVTITVANLAPVENAYNKYLGYHVVERGKIDKATADLWNAPKVAGHDYIVMQPESNAPHYIRFVVTADYPDYKPFTTHGWNATEILVQDVDAVATKLKDSPFQIVGAPGNIAMTVEVKAMQAIGPAKEVLYFTKSKTLGNAESPVDRFFIVIDGGKDMNALLDFYSGLGGKTSPVMPTRMTVLNQAIGLDSETKHPLAIARVEGPFMVELDQYPDAVKARHVRAGDLPPGMAMVTIQTDSIASGGMPLKGVISHGDKTTVIRSPSGALIELVERR